MREAIRLGDRVILMGSLPGRIVNVFYRALASLTVVPNIEGDKRGFAKVGASAAT